jgi:hypothetical protein
MRIADVARWVRVVVPSSSRFESRPGQPVLATSAGIYSSSDRLTATAFMRFMSLCDLEPCTFLANDSGVFDSKVHVLCVSTALRMRQ